MADKAEVGCQIAVGRMSGLMVGSGRSCQHEKI